MKFSELLEKYRQEALSEREKGYRFERLMVDYLMTDRRYEGKFSKIWLWRDFPHRLSLNPGGGDIGIDLVALDDEGGWWAIQCKCYQASASVDKSALDSFLGASGKKFKNHDGEAIPFSNRLWISTTNRWTLNAENEIAGQAIPVARIRLSDLESASVNWELLSAGIRGEGARLPRKTIRDHQRGALLAAREHYEEKGESRGQISMACGTGKTYLSLKVAEDLTGGRGLILFLAPSIALVAQTLREWAAEAAWPIYPICVCSDSEVGLSRRGGDESDSCSVEDLGLPATTDPKRIAERIRFAKRVHADRLKVVFSTYHSIDQVSKALHELSAEVDLVICDEAHRTTGAIFADKRESAFVRVHDNAVIPAARRLYMTATPRLYSSDAKSRAEGADIVLCSMDDESLYGRRFYTLGFGEAVDKELLSDYKILVVTVQKGLLSEAAQKELAGDKKEFDADDAARLYGCLHALSKHMDLDGQSLNEADPAPMRRAVAFCSRINASTAIAEAFGRVKEKWLDEVCPPEAAAETSKILVDIKGKHIDGTMGASERDERISWLKEESEENPKECRVLCNARLLSEGVDVPTLDAVLFLSARNSEIEVVQSVGRVMRKAPGKKFGYIIIPALVPSYVDPEDALDENKPYQVIWTVANALKAHDDRFQSLINRIQFNDKKPDGGGSLLIGGIPKGGSKSIAERAKRDILADQRQDQSPLYRALFGRLVTKVGFSGELRKWAGDVAKLAEGFKSRISNVVSQEGPHKAEFELFLAGLRGTLNPSVDAGQAIEMLAQHLITKPIFDALFSDYAFIDNNPVSKYLESMIEVLDNQGLGSDKAVLDRFYQRVRNEVSGITSAAAKQKIIVRLYDNFFREAMPKAVEQLGIVYTPVEVVDFIINSLAEILKREFNKNISDAGVHILDPFTGTGTFITRLIQSGLLGDSLDHKFATEIHANEITLLAYYIANINIENAYHSVKGEDSIFKPFEGICLTDTFQIYESTKENLFNEYKLKKNSDRVENQKKSPIIIIVGNPPYSVGQRSANDNAQNQSYPDLDKRISETYAKKSTATLKNSLYDSYIKSFRWASDRLDDQFGGIIAFISNSGWLDGNAMDGMRKCLVKEFNKIYIFNLRGNQRTSGELSKKEGGKIFGSGSRAGISISFLVKNPKHNNEAEIYYKDIGDYLTTKQKLELLTDYHYVYNNTLKWHKIIPNEAGDWINQRSDKFNDFIIIGDKINKTESKTFFKPVYSSGVKTNRDIWCYNFSLTSLKENINSSISYYNDQVTKLKPINNSNKLKIDEIIDFTTNKFVWDRQQKSDVIAQKFYKFDASSCTNTIYRPFTKQNVYFNRSLNNCVYLLPQILPSKLHKNLIICLPGLGGTKEFSSIITNLVPDYELIGKSQCFPRYYYEDISNKPNSTLPRDNVFDGYMRYDAITDYIYNECKSIYGINISKDDIFYYVYGLLHSEDYRAAFSADLKKMLPRLPLVADSNDFQAFSQAGRDLAELHLNYETVKPYDKVAITGLENENAKNFEIDKIRYVNKFDKTAIQYNSHIKISGIPLEAYDYVLNGKSAIDWILERYQVKVDKDTGIRNDPNDWAREHREPRYILDLLLRVITVSLETMRIIKSLPEVDFS